MRQGGGKRVHLPGVLPHILNATTCREELEPELNTGLVSEIALILIAFGESITKPGQHIIGLNWSDSPMVRNWNVQATADHEVPCVVAWVVHNAGGEPSAKVAIKAGVGPAKQNFAEGFKMLRAKLEYGTHVVGEQIRRSRGRAGDGVAVGDCAALIPGKFSLNSNHRIKVKSHIAAAAVERVTIQSPTVFRIKAKVGIVTVDFNFRIVLSEGDSADEQDSHEDNSPLHCSFSFYMQFKETHRAGA